MKDSTKAAKRKLRTHQSKNIENLLGEPNESAKNGQSAKEVDENRTQPFHIIGDTQNRL